MHLATFFFVASHLASAGGDLLLNTGDNAPPFSMRDLDRDMFSLAHHTGRSPKQPRKAVLMAFFATWCKPCLKEIPIIKAINKTWKKKGVEIIYVGLSQGANELQPFAEKHGLPWRVVPDSFGLLSRRYGASQLPHLFIVDSSGKIGFQHRGIAPDLRKTLDGQLARITGAPIPPGADEDAPTVVIKARFDTKFIMGRVPSAPGSASRWNPLATYLGEQVGAEITILGAENYEAFEQDLRQGKFDIANAGPLLCHSVRDQYEPLVRVERQGNGSYLGILFTRRDSPVRKLADLRGKTVGLVALKSSSGGLYPQKALLDAGLIPGRAVEIKWLGSHTSVAKAVKAGRVDAGGCFEDCRDMAWESVRAKATGTRILGYTDEIPAELIVVKRSLKPAVKESLRKHLLGLNEAEGILTQMSQGELTVTGIFEASQRDLVAVGEVVQEVIAKTAAR